MVPILCSGGSTPPSAKFREVRQQTGPAGTPSLHSGPSSAHMAAAAVDARSRVPAITQQAPLSTRLDHNMMWSRLAQDIPASPPSQMLSVAPSSVGSTPRANAATPRKRTQPVPATQSPPRSARSETTPQVPLRAALQQLKGVTDSLVPTRRSSSRRRGRDAAGGAHAAAGSPSPERERGSSEAAGRQASERPNADERAGPSRCAGGPPEDRYFKILQSLQAKGAVGGLALRTKLLEGSSSVGIAAAVKREAIEAREQDDNREELSRSLKQGAFRRGEAMRRLMGPDSDSDSSHDGG